MAKKNKSDWKPSENILKYLKSWEKFEPELYDDKKGNITIGYGFHLPHLLKKYKNGITVEEADKEFEGVVNTFVPEFIRRTPNFKNLNNNQRDALFSLFYNTGGPEYSKSPMLFKYLKEGDYDKAVKEINHNENEKGMGGQKKRRAFERRVFSTPTYQPWTVDDDSNYVLIEDKPVENESIEKDTNDSKYEDARHVEAKYGYTGYIGGGYDGNKVRISDSNMKSVGISNNADPDKWYESVNPILDTDPISLIADFIPTMKRMLDPNRERSGEDTATDFEEKMWKAYTDGDISRLPASKYRFDDDDNDAQYVGLPQEQAILIQSLLDKEYMNNMLDEAYKNADEKSKLKIRDYKKVLDKLNKNIFENPGKWILVNEGVSPFREEVYGDNFEKVNEASGLGALKNFSVRWDPDAGMLDVKDDYDFSRKKIAEDIIPERDVPLRIRERIKYDPKKGSVLRNNDKALPKRFVRKYEEGGEAKHWWSDTDKRDEIIKRQNDNGEWQEKRRRLLEQAHSDLEKGEIDEDEFRRIAGFSNSEIGNLIISKDGNGEKIGAIINNLLDSIDIDKVKGGIGDAKEGKEDKNKEDAYPYKLMVESLLTLADVASSTPGMLRLYNKMGLDLMPILKTIAESSKIQTIAGLSNIGIDGSQIALDPEGDNAFNYAGILGGAAEAIGGTNVVRNMSFMGRYGNKVDDILDIANPVISTLGIVDDVSNMEDGGAKYRYITSMDNASVGWDIDEKPEMEEGGFVPDWTLQRNKLINRRGVSRCKDGGVVSNSDFTKDTSMARDALRMDSSYNPSYSYIPQNNTSNHSFDIESLIKESSGIKPYDDMPDIKKHKVHKGDTLWSISKKTGVHIDDIILYNPQIKDINKIEIGDEVNLEAPISNPKALDYKEIKKKESVLNKSGDNAAIIKSVQHNNNFAIIDKKKKVIEVYSPDNELLYTGRIGTGRSGDDYNTITYSKKDGSIIDGKGNNSTPAGITMVTGKSTYHGVPAFIRSRYNKETGKWDDNVASSMHWGASGGSNGCVRLIGDTANELDKYIKQGSMVYTLPEKDGSRFMVRDGMLSYIADNPYGKNEKGDPKRYWDDYNTFNDKTYKPIDISQIDSDININVNHASMSPKAIARDLLLRFVDTGDRNENVNAFISGIEDYKKAIMADTGIDSATYNDLADIALGIAEQESKFGTSVKYALKNALTQEQLDLLKTIKGGVKGVAKDLNNIDEITWDGVLEHFKKPISDRSNGITQIKTRGDNYRTRVLYDKYGIDEESLKNPYMSGAGTMLRLASIYRDEVAGRKFKGPEGDIDPMDAVLYKWSGRNRLLRSGKANPKLDEYHNNVKKYVSNFRINTVDKFDERLGGDEATVPDKPAMNIDDVTPSLVWEKNTGLSGVDERRQYVPLYVEGGAVEKQREAYKYLTEKRGMSKIQALAVIGNLMAESMLKDDVYGDNGTSYGIQQWHNERMDMLFKQARKKGHSEPTFQDQLEFLADEYEGKTGYSNFLYTRKGKEGPGYYNYSRQDFMNADNLKDAVVAWNQGAGRPHKSVIRNDDRYNYAMEVAKNLGLDIEENSVSSYGQMGFGDDGEIAASVTLPEVEVAAALPNPEAPSQERQSEEERFRTWTETYGKDIINHLLTLDRERKDGNDDDYSMMYKQREKESEEDKKMALINAVLPNIQLRIKGVTEN